jgi:hypothetical protein
MRQLRQLGELVGEDALNVWEHIAFADFLEHAIISPYKKREILESEYWFEIQDDLEYPETSIWTTSSELEERLLLMAEQDEEEEEEDD